MNSNKLIDRGDQGANTIFDQRTLANDYRTLVPMLKKGSSVLDVGCGTGAISKDIAAIVGETGNVIGIDNTKAFIESGKKSWAGTTNLELIAVDIFDYEPVAKFDLIVSARTLQWLSNPGEALQKIRSMLKPGGRVSILDYNHEGIEWDPAPPESMAIFYATFLKWRADAGMNNHIAADLPELMAHAGFHNISALNADEFYYRSETDFKIKSAIWSKVATSRQMVDEGYILDVERLRAIDDYNQWIDTIGISMKMKLSDVSGTN